MSVEHVMSRARDPIEVSVGESDYIYYGLPPHLREEPEEEPQDDGFDVDIGEPTLETLRPSLLSEVTQPAVPLPDIADSWNIETAPFSALDIPVSTDSFIEPELPSDDLPLEEDSTDLSALIIDATDTEDFENADGGVTTIEFEALDLPFLDPTSPGIAPIVLAPDPPSDMLDGWGAAESEEQEDDVSTTGITLIEAVSETGEYVVGDEAGIRLRALETRLKQFLELDDLTDALEVVEQILELEPEHGLALEARATCGEKLIKMYESKVGGNLGATPVVLLPPDQLVWQDLDHRAGFILSQVDGASRFQDILLISGMDRLDTMRILAQLVQDGVIGTT
jgi:hypothetical protein